MAEYIKLNFKNAACFCHAIAFAQRLEVSTSTSGCVSEKEEETVFESNAGTMLIVLDAVCSTCTWSEVVKNRQRRNAGDGRTLTRGLEERMTEWAEAWENDKVAARTGGWGGATDVVNKSNND